MACVTFTDCYNCTTNDCFWNTKEQKCGGEEATGYSQQCLGDDIIRFNSGLQYKNKNIKSSDDTVGYVSSNGVLKAYKNAADLAATSGKNGCPTTTESVNTLWSKLGFAIGTAMASGQSCGNESSYVTAQPPENSFDAVWYASNNSLRADQDALAHWNATGMKAGKAPNANILTSMKQLGKVGYIDANTVLHPIADVTYTGYKSYPGRVNITGTKMVDCTEIFYVKYTTLVNLVHNDVTASLTNDSVAVFNSKAKATDVNLYIHALEAAARSKTEVMFGDSISLSTSISNEETACGTGGCKVSKLGTTSMELSFGPGGTSVESFKFEPSNDDYAIGDKIPVGAPFIITTVRQAPHNSLFQNDPMLPGASIESSNGEYTMTFTAKGTILLQKGSTDVWESEEEDDAPKQMKLNDSGIIKLSNNSGAYWSSDKIVPGQKPFVLAVQNNGRLVVYDKTRTIIWSKGAASTPDVDPTETLTYTATVTSDKRIKFVSATNTPAVFTFTDSTVDTTSEAACDKTALENACGSGCFGFILDTAKNQWEKITKDTEFKVSETAQDYHMKIPKAASADTSCPTTKTATFVDPVMFSNYPAGSAYSSTSTTQCKTDLNMPEFRPTYSDLTEPSMGQDDLMDAYEKLEEDREKFGKQVELIKKYDSIDNPGLNVTLEQQKVDSGILDNQAIVFYYLWGAFALGVVGFLLLNQYTDASYLSPTLKFIGFGVLFLLFYAGMIGYKRWIG